MSTPVVKNAADEGQVAAAKVKEIRGRKRELEDLRAILATVEGRRFLWRCLEKAKVFESIWVSSAQIHYNSGWQDSGHFVMAEIIAADPDAFFKMMMEAKAEAEMPEPEKPKEEKEK